MTAAPRSINSAAERALRAVALGRKNYLFCVSDGGGESAAAIYTLLGTARLNGRDPERGLRQVLRCIADHPLSRSEELLPWNMAADLQPVAELSEFHFQSVLDTTDASITACDGSRNPPACQR
jgi:hypothetical protein